LGCLGDSLVGTEDEQFPGSARVLFRPGGESAGKFGLHRDGLRHEENVAKLEEFQGWKDATGDDDRTSRQTPAINFDEAELAGPSDAGAPFAKLKTKGRCFCFGDEKRFESAAGLPPGVGDCQGAKGCDAPGFAVRAKNNHARKWVCPRRHERRSATGSDPR